MVKKSPSDTKIEKEVLGEMLFDNDCVPEIIDILKAEMFSLPTHQKIFGVICKLFQENKPIDIITVYTVDKDLDPGYLSELTQEISSSANSAYHAKIILELWVKRNLIAKSQDVIKSCYENEDCFDIIEMAEDGIFQTTQEIYKQDAKNLVEVYKELSEHIDSIKSKGKNDFAIQTMFYDLDHILGGLRKGELIVIAARPSMGKSSIALNIAQNVQVNVGWFSLEMSSLSLSTRAMASKTGIDAHRILSGQIKQDEYPKFAREIYNDRGNIFIDDCSSLTPIELRSKAMKLKMKHKIGLVCVDYLQLMHVKKPESREREISQISTSLKALARDLDIPVIALSQLNRGLEYRQDKHPLLSDLRESGSLEQDSDVVIFIYRPEMYGILTDGDGNSLQGIAEIIVAKQRNGPVGSCNLRFNKNITTFQNLEFQRCKLSDIDKFI